MEATEHLAQRYARSHPQAAAKRLADLPGDEAAVFLEGLEPEIATSIVADFRPEEAASVLECVSTGRASEILTMLNLNDGVAILRHLPHDACDRILLGLPASLASRARSALAFPAGTAGALADAAVSTFDAETTAGEALSRGIDPRLPYLYIVDREHRPVGVLHVRDLLQADQTTPLRSIMKAPVHTITSSAPLNTIHRHGAWSTLDALPVVDGRGALVGVIRHKALRAAGPPVMAGGPTSAVKTLLDLGEVYWSGLYSAIEALAEDGSENVQGGPR